MRNCPASAPVLMAYVNPVHLVIVVMDRLVTILVSYKSYFMIKHALHSKMSAHWQGVPLTRFVSIILARMSVATVWKVIMEIKPLDANSIVTIVTLMQHARMIIDWKSKVLPGVYA